MTNHDAPDRLASGRGRSCFCANWNHLQIVISVSTMNRTTFDKEGGYRQPMPKRLSNPLARFFDADRKRHPEHSHRWWGAYFGLANPADVSSWVGEARRRIGPKYEQKVFAALERYWHEHPEFEPYRFTLEQYRSAVPTAAQSAKRRKRRAA